MTRPTAGRRCRPRAAPRGADKLERVAARFVWPSVTAVAIAALALAMGHPARAETMESALATAYQNNPQLNAQRANVRKTDESIPQALSGYRATVNGAVEVGRMHTRTEVIVPPVSGGSSGPSAPSQPGGAPSTSGGMQSGGTAFVSGTTTPRSAVVNVSKTLYDGFQTANKTRAAEAQVWAARETLRFVEQSVLLAAATVYMDLLRDEANLQVQRSNVRVLQQSAKETRARRDQGAATDIDVAQFEAQLASGEALLFAAESTLMATRANYRRVIGVEPTSLAPAATLDRLMPNSLDAAIVLAMSENPMITAAMYGVDVAVLETKAAEGSLYPNLSVQGTVAQQLEPNLLTPKLFTESIMLSLKIPVYQGGKEYSLIRQNKEAIGQQRLTVDQVRDQVRADVVRFWWVLRATRSQLEAAQRQVRASETAFRGIQAEAQQGHRTSYDILVSQQALVNGRVSILTAQHDRVVASYNFLAMIGRLSAQQLGLQVDIYDPTTHYHQVRDAWFGVRTPDGR